jgi:hypothetical protein
VPNSWDFMGRRIPVPNSWEKSSKGKVGENAYGASPSGYLLLKSLYGTV